MFEMITFPVILLLGFSIQLWTLIGPAGLLLLVLGLCWAWDLQ